MREGLACDDMGAFHATVDEDLVVEFLGHVTEIGRRNILFLYIYKKMVNVLAYDYTVGVTKKLKKHYNIT